MTVTLFRERSAGKHLGIITIRFPPLLLRCFSGRLNSPILALLPAIGVAQSICAIFLLLLMTGHARGQSGGERHGDRDAIAKALCKGKYDGTHCDACGEWQDGVSFWGPDLWSLESVTFGHFLTAKSDDAFVGITGCKGRPGAQGFTVLVSRRSGKWKEVDNNDDLEAGDCHKMRFWDGRDLLLCEGYGTPQFSEIRYLEVLSAKDGTIQTDLLFQALDNSHECAEVGRVHKATLDKVSYTDLNGDGLEDVSITASLVLLR